MQGESTKLVRVRTAGTRGWLSDSYERFGNMDDALETLLRDNVWEVDKGGGAVLLLEGLTKELVLIQLFCYTMGQVILPVWGCWQCLVLSSAAVLHPLDQLKDQTLKQLMLVL